jgi:V8-like Glu-specific endopeptidase
VDGVDFNRLTGPQRKMLREALVGVFRRSRDLDMFLDDNGFEPLGEIVESGPFQAEVFELIRELERSGRLADLVTKVRGAHADAPALQDLVSRLGLADSGAEQQRVVRSTGLGLERMVRDAGFEDLNLWAGRLVAAGKKICRISYPQDTGDMRGTGFLVAADLVLTNYHVLEPVIKGTAKAGTVQINFGYAETESGVSAGSTVKLHDAWQVASAPYSAADLREDGVPAAGELDFALLRLAAPAGEKLGWFKLRDSKPAPEDTIVFVLQHPEGKPLKQSVGILRESQTPLRLRYDADTEPGSSGAAVLDQRLELVALHHAGDPNFKTEARYNQGVPIALIRKHLEGDAKVPKFWET